MAVTVRIPTPLRKLTNDQETVSANESRSLAELIDALEEQHPGLKERLCDETGELRRFVNIYVNGEDVRFLSGLQTPIEAGAEVSIVPAVAGGTGEAAD
ncbi:MAG: molybdopterin synthase sulfur carrier subunit [Chloroflexi bacterium RBG_16_68_14]|nr:MAG: molybdopterin synthase sulfur carrier subunit [Chloroflexi bacterium RBG_16_68_14]